MKVLLLHPRDNFHLRRKDSRWDLIVDLGRAPTSVYEPLSGRDACPVISIYEFAKGVEDLLQVKCALQAGMGYLVDGWKTDWWGILSVEIVPQLQQLILVHRLAKYLNQECDISSSRSDYRSAALHRILGGRLTNLETPFQAATRRLRHYSELVSEFDSSQIFQVAQDKFDRGHAIRRRFAKRSATSSRPSILLPTAYTNVSRMALSYAALLPDEQFLLVCARDSGKVQELPANVQMISLDPYFSSPNLGEISSLVEMWAKLKMRLMSFTPEYESASAVGVFDRIPSLIRWEITVRDAWKRLFESENIRSCFCADHANPYTRIPLLLAKHAGIPAVACHHGALDASMALTTHDADFYVAKTEMERDYMTRICGISSQKVFCISERSSAELTSNFSDSKKRSWLVFFSEPYNAWSWRIEEVYRELLPRLCALAETCGLKLVFKLHPFETAKGHRKILLRHLPAEKVRQIEVITGPISEQLWRNTRFALTVQSSVALECAARSIPIFLCGWLGDSFSGYIQQYERFGVGHLLESATQIDDIPQLLELRPAKFGARPDHPDPMGAETLRELLAPPLCLTVARQS
jgi:hypothetical protein